MAFTSTSTGLLIPGEETSSCAICGDRVPAHQLTDHSVSCAKRHKDELYEEGLRRQQDMFEHDYEQHEWLKRRAKHGAA